MNFRWFIALFMIVIIIAVALFFSLHPTGNVVKVSEGTGVYSENWAGYVSFTDLQNPEINSVDSVSANWNVPEVKCPISMGDYFSALWVGVDGIFSKTIDQIGTDSDCISGKAYYYSWFEIYPNNSMTIDMVIKPGDEMHGEINYIGNNNFQLTIENMNTGQKFQTIQEDSDATRTTAEIIVEAPYIQNKSIAYLSDFGPVEFHNINVTMKGQTGAINNPDKWIYQKLIMIDPRGYVRAIPSDISDSGKQFYVYWERSS